MRIVNRPDERVKWISVVRVRVQLEGVEGDEKRASDAHHRLNLPRRSWRPCRTSKISVPSTVRRETHPRACAFCCGGKQRHRTAPCLVTRSESPGRCRLMPTTPSRSGAYMKRPPRRFDFDPFAFPDFASPPFSSSSRLQLLSTFCPSDRVRAWRRRITLPAFERTCTRGSGRSRGTFSG